MRQKINNETTPPQSKRPGGPVAARRHFINNMQKILVLVGALACTEGVYWLMAWFIGNRQGVAYGGVEYVASVAAFWLGFFVSAKLMIRFRKNQKKRRMQKMQANGFASPDH